MSLTKINRPIVVGNTTIQRRVEERTSHIQILTPFSEDGSRNYSVVAYREWVEYENDVPVKITTLPPLVIDFDPTMQPIANAITAKIDSIALSRTATKKWPVQDNELLTP